MRPARRWLPLLCFAAVCVLLATGVYVVAFDTERGRSWDAHALVRATAGQDLPTVQRTSRRLIDTIDVGSLVLFGGAIVAVALLFRRPRAAVAAVLVIACANATTQVLKPVLGAAAPFGKRNELGSSFPSGHSTVAMSLALAAVLAVPLGWKLLVSLIGAGYAAAVGISLLVQGWHFASDVAGAFLLTGAWAALVAALVPPDERSAESRELKTGFAVAALSVVGFAAALSVAVATHPHVTVRLELHTRLAVTFGALAAVALAVSAGLALILQASALRSASATRS